MAFKPEKSNSLVLKECQVSSTFWFTITRLSIPTIMEKPVRSYKKMFKSTLKDGAVVKNVCEELVGWLKKTNKTDLPGNLKIWLHPHGLLPRILWPY